MFPRWYTSWAVRWPVLTPRSNPSRRQPRPALVLFGSPPSLRAPRRAQSVSQLFEGIEFPNQPTIVVGLSNGVVSVGTHMYSPDDSFPIKLASGRTPCRWDVCTDRRRLGVAWRGGVRCSLTQYDCGDRSDIPTAIRSEAPAWCGAGHDAMCTIN